FLHKFGLIPRNWLLNTVYPEVVNLPFHSESQGAISKNSFSCLLNIVTCDRGVGMRKTFTGEFVATFLILYSLKAFCWYELLVAVYDR
ncbi:MAG: hypothetical protein ACLUT9_08255, partial [Enterococcus faecium]